jgi:hypothetical protein
MNGVTNEYAMRLMIDFHQFGLYENNARGNEAGQFANDIKTFIVINCNL